MGRLQAHLAHSGTVAAIQVCEALVPDRGDNIHNWYAAYGTHDGGWADHQNTTLLERTRLSSSTHRTTISLGLDVKTARGGDKTAGGGVAGAAAVLRRRHGHASR